MGTGPKGSPGRSGRRAALGALAAVLAGLGTWFFAWRDEPPAPRAAPPIEVPAPPPAAPLPALPAQRPAATAPAAPAPPPDEGDRYKGWADKVALFPRDLGAWGASLKQALDQVRNGDMDYCFKQLDEARAKAEGAEQYNRHRQAVIQLYLLTREDHVDVVDATVWNQGELPASVVDCCREVLRFLELRVFGPPPGQRFRYLYEVEE